MARPLVRRPSPSIAAFSSTWHCQPSIISITPPFVAIRERPERGAFHLHVAVCGRQDIKYLRRCWYIALGASPDAEGDQTPGAVNVKGPSKRWGGQGYQWRADKLAGYLGVSRWLPYHLGATILTHRRTSGHVTGTCPKRSSAGFGGVLVFLFARGTAGLLFEAL